MLTIYNHLLHDKMLQKLSVKFSPCKNFSTPRGLCFPMLKTILYHISETYRGLLYSYKTNLAGMSARYLLAILIATL